MEKVTVTDLLTSARHYKAPESNFHGFDMDKKDGYTWQGRISSHTEEELAEGRRINPFIQIEPVEAFAKAMQIDLKPEDKGKHAIFWLVKGNGLGIGSLYFKHISVPAFTDKDIKGDFVEIELED